MGGFFNRENRFNLLKYEGRETCCTVEKTVFLNCPATVGRFPSTEDDQSLDASTWSSRSGTSCQKKTSECASLIRFVHQCQRHKNVGLTFM